ncbi:hypothetical protein [Oryzifoliimicrobium ureilyticus]|uniref:hypothetical protein n=1 Tax=Oryzifoliimicrobium ureilyticus TaxID=3113724 RepID=UPI003075FB86
MKILKFLFIIAIAVVATCGFRWYRYVTNTQSPYDEVGIELNSRMPTPIRKWGCSQLQSTFGQMLPPYGCQAGADNRSWL